MFSLHREAAATQLTIELDRGTLACRRCTIPASSGQSAALLSGSPIGHQVHREGEQVVFQFAERLVLREGDRLRLEVA
jgi:hypothetical protein